MNAVPEASRQALRLFALSSVGPDSTGEPRDIAEVGVAHSPAGSEVTLAAIGDSLCVVRQRSISCNEGARAVAGELFGAAPDGCGGYHLLGAVPDGVTQLSVDRRGDGSLDTNLPVTSNVYEASLSAVDTVVTGVNSAGEAVFKVELPLEWYAATNDACK